MTVIDRPELDARRGGGWVPKRLLSGRALRAAAAQVAPVLALLSGQEELHDVAAWSVLSAGWTITGTATFVLGLAGLPPRGVLRLSGTGGRRMRHEGVVLAALSAEPGLAPVRRLIPARRAEGVLDGWQYSLDDYLPGVDAPAALTDEPSLEPAVLHSAVEVATVLHRVTARPVLVDDEVLHRWVDVPAEVLARALRSPVLRPSARGVDVVRRRLTAALAGRELPAGWIHGDFWLGNLRVDPTSGTVTGVIDWDCADRGEWPAQDLLHLALYGSSLQRGVSLGSVVAETVGRGTWTPDCEDVLRHARWAWAGQLSDADAALLYWLRYTAVMITQQHDYVHHSILAWEWRNVVRVLRAL